MSISILNSVDTVLDRGVGLLSAVTVGSFYGLYQGLYRGVTQASDWGERGHFLGRTVRQVIITDSNLIGRGAIVTVGYLLSSNLEECAKINTLITGIVTYFASQNYRLLWLSENIQDWVEFSGLSMGLVLGLMKGFVEGFLQNVSSGYFQGRAIYQMTGGLGGAIGRVVQRHLTPHQIQETQAEKLGKIVFFIGMVFAITRFFIPYAIEKLKELGEDTTIDNGTLSVSINE